MNGRRRKGKLGIALAGGGPLDAIYEIGALVALEKALTGVSLTDLDVYVGVSSGAFVTAGLANGISPREMRSMFVLERSHHDPFEPDLLLRPAFGEFARRLMRLPELMQAAAFAYFGASPTGCRLASRRTIERKASTTLRHSPKLRQRQPVVETGVVRPAWRV